MRAKELHWSNHYLLSPRSEQENKDQCQVKALASLCSGSYSAHIALVRVAGDEQLSTVAIFYSVWVPATCVLRNSTSFVFAATNHHRNHNRNSLCMITLPKTEQQWSPACSDITCQPLHIQQRVRSQPAWASFRLAGMMALLGFSWQERSVFNVAWTKQTWQYTISNLNKMQTKGEAIRKQWHWSFCVFLETDRVVFESIDPLSAVLHYLKYCVCVNVNPGEVHSMNMWTDMGQKKWFLLVVIINNANFSQPFVISLFASYLRSCCVSVCWKTLTFVSMCLRHCQLDGTLHIHHS